MAHTDHSISFREDSLSPLLVGGRKVKKQSVFHNVAFISQYFL